jgi:hypothetical protein
VIPSAASKGTVGSCTIANTSMIKFTVVLGTIFLTRAAATFRLALRLVFTLAFATMVFAMAFAMVFAMAFAMAAALEAAEVTATEALEAAEANFPFVVPVVSVELVDPVGVVGVVDPVGVAVWGVREYSILLLG